MVASTWARFECWVKANGGTNIVQTRVTRPSSSYHNAVSRTWSDAQFWDTSTEHVFRQIKIPGYISQSGHDVWYDDVFVRPGAGSAARVLIGEAQNFSQCYDLRRCNVTPGNWSASSITANVDTDVFLPGRYIHTIDANNQHTNGGVGRLISNP
jgi:hypothetical protein